MFASPEPRTQPSLPASLPAPAEVVSLPSPGLPADHGLASLGLVMQLTGRTTAALVALVASLAWIDGRLDHLGASHTAWLALGIALCIARSHLHRSAGRDLTYGRRTAEGTAADPFAAMRGYIGFALGQAVAIGAIAAQVFGQPLPAAAGITAALALWPCALAVISYRSHASLVQSLHAGLPLGEDRGLEGASIAMTVLGAYGVVSTGGIVVMLGALSPHHQAHGWGVMLVVVFALLVMRSSLHIRAGLAGLRDSSFDRPSELAGRYAAFGVISAFCVGGVLSLLAMSERLTPDAILSVAVACWLLVAWPMIVKRYFSQRQFAELLAGDRVTHRRAPDAGLTALGWLLAGHATLVAGVVIVQVTGYPRLGPQLGRAADHVLVLSGLAVGRWWLVDAGLAAASVVLELIAAAALIRMSDQRRAITTIYAVFAGVVALGPAVPVLASLGHHLSIWTGIQLLPSAVQLVMPVAALMLVHRAVIPAARATYRSHGGHPPLAPPAKPSGSPSSSGPVSLRSTELSRVDVIEA